MFCYDTIKLDRSEIDDINLGLQHYQEEFNVINARLIASGVSTPIALVSSAPFLPDRR